MRCWTLLVLLLSSAGHATGPRAHLSRVRVAQPIMIGSPHRTLLEMLPEELVKTLRASGIKSLNELQTAVLPHALRGGDVLVHAETGISMRCSVSCSRPACLGRGPCARTADAFVLQAQVRRSALRCRCSPLFPPSRKKYHLRRCVRSWSVQPSNSACR